MNEKCEWKKCDVHACAWNCMKFAWSYIYLGNRFLLPFLPIFVTWHFLLCQVLDSRSWYVVWSGIWIVPRDHEVLGMNTVSKNCQYSGLNIWLIIWTVLTKVNKIYHKLWQTLALNKHMTSSKADIVSHLNPKQTNTLHIIQANAGWHFIHTHTHTHTNTHTQEVSFPKFFFWPCGHAASFWPKTEAAAWFYVEIATSHKHKSEGLINA